MGPRNQCGDDRRGRSDSLFKQRWRASAIASPLVAPVMPATLGILFSLLAKGCVDASSCAEMPVVKSGCGAGDAPTPSGFMTPVRTSALGASKTLRCGGVSSCLRRALNPWGKPNCREGAGVVVSRGLAGASRGLRVRYSPARRRLNHSFLVTVANRTPSGVDGRT